MEKEVVPSLEFGADHILGLDLVGTVELPSPVPAAGRIYLVRYPSPPGDQAQHKLFIKIVEKINDSHIITRIVSPEHVRAIRFNSSGAAGTNTETTVLNGNQLRREIESIDWQNFVRDHRSSYEIELRPQQTGVVMVPESSPVILRHEQTVPAATSLSITPGAQPCPHSR